MMEVGYPRTGAVIDQKYKTIASPKWVERTPEISRETMLKAAHVVKFAAIDLNSCCEMMSLVVQKLWDTPEGNRMAAIQGDLEKLLTELKGKQEEYEKRAGR